MQENLNTLLKVSLENIKEIVDVNTVIGERIVISEGVSVIPVSMVKMKYLAGGSDFNGKSTVNPFGGGSGGSMSITPVGFLVISGNDIKVLHLDNTNHIIDRLVDSIKSLIEKMRDKRVEN